MSIPSGALTPIPIERIDFTELDRQRRLNLSRFICLASMALLGLVAPIMGLSFILNPDAAKAIPPALFYALIGGAFALFAGSYVFIQRRRAIPATVIIILTPLVAATGYQVYVIAHSGLTAQVATVFCAYLLMIAFSGVLGGPRLILIATGIAALVTIILCLLPPAATDLNNSLTIIFSVLVQQGAIASITFVANRAYQRTLMQLSDTRAQFERAAQLDALKDEFITNINHELRNPIMALLGYLQALQRAPNLDRAAIVAQIDEAYSAGQNVRGLLESILDARRLDQGAADFTPEVVDVLMALRRAVQLIDPREVRGQERDLRISVPPGFTIWGESTRLQQILTNLLSNAIKYSAPGSAVEVTAQLRPLALTPGAAPQLLAELVVRDYGLGIPPEQRDLLFGRFVRLPRDLASNVIGNGLGLYLCRVLTRAMGGQIWVESAGIPGEGSAFHIALPLPPVGAAPSA